MRDLRVRWALEEAGLAYEQRLIGPADQKTDAYRDLQPFGQVEVHRRVEAHAAGLDLLLQGDPGEGLGDRADAEQGAVRIDGAARRLAVDAIALFQHHLAVLDHGDGDAGQVLVGHGRGHQAVDIGLQQRRIERQDARRGYDGGAF